MRQQIDVEYTVTFRQTLYTRDPSELDKGDIAFHLKPDLKDAKPEDLVLTKTTVDGKPFEFKD